MKILVSGAAGMVGSAVKEVFGGYHKLTLTDIKICEGIGDMDVRDYDTVMSYAQEKPDMIIHLAAETNLEICQKNPKNAYLTNHTGTTHMMLLARRLNIPIVYISTAGVFNGEKESAYTAWDEPCALNHYGRSKWFGELALQPYNKVWIFRAGWMMGGGPDIDKKFVNIIYKQIKAGAKEIRAVCDMFGSPTYTHDLVDTIKNAVVQSAPYGIYSCGGEGRPSRYGVACEIVKIFEAQNFQAAKGITVIPVKDGFFKKQFSCPRSKCEALNNVKLNTMGLSKMRPWREALKEYIEKCYTL